MEYPRPHDSVSWSGREALTGLVERVTFHNPDNGFCIIRVKALGYRELVTVLGHAASIAAGEHVFASGGWENHREHGRQFRAAFLKVTAPTSIEGMRRYLGSGLIKGIGPVFAKRLVDAFEERVFEIIEEQPERLFEVDGIGEKRARSILAGWADQRAIREIMAFLQGHGIGTSRAVRIYKTYGADAVPLVSEDPYRLARDIVGIGFKSADIIAERLGIARTAMIRARAGIVYTLMQALTDGHCGLPEEQLLGNAEQLLEIPKDILFNALVEEVAAGSLIIDEDSYCVFLAHLWRAERTIARRLLAIAKEPPPWPAIDAGRAIEWVQRKIGIELASSQRKAIELALASKLMVVTGGPGVGKTTLVNSILKILHAKGVRTELCAPTGRAAKRLAESAGHPARTIHRLLEADPGVGGFKRGENNPLECDLLVVDEASMLDVPLTAAIVRALSAKSGLLFVGDVDQLPSVGPGRVLADIIASGAAPTARLSEIFRQAAQSPIVVNAHKINRGEMPDLTTAEGGDFYFVEAREPEDAARKIVELVAGRVPRRFGLDPIRDVQVLCPMNRGRVGARALNADLQATLNGDQSKAAVSRFGWTFRVGDKVMQTANDYDKEVFNGDLGFVVSIDMDAQEVTLEFDGRVIAYGFGELDEVVPAYATTIHKAQGSEYPAVVIPLSIQHFMMLRRNLVYTAITRARRLAVIVGQKRALSLALRNSRDEKRWSKLVQWLTEPE